MNLFPTIGFCFLPLAAFVFYGVSSGQFTLFSAVRGVFFGLAAVGCTALLQVFLAPLARSLTGVPLLLFRAFFVAALLEESVKLLLVRCLPEIRRHALPGDGEASPRRLLSLAVVVGLSFASFETLMYALRDPAILYARSMTALPLHGATVLLCSAALFRGRSGAGLFLAAVLLHGAYNLCMEASGVLIFPGILCVLFALWYAARVWRNEGRYE